MDVNGMKDLSNRDKTQQMSKPARFLYGIATLVESKAICPYCERKIEFEELEDKWVANTTGNMRFKDKCKRFIGITVDLKGDITVDELYSNAMECSAGYFETFQFIALEELDNFLSKD